MAQIYHGPWTHRQRMANKEIARINAWMRAEKKVVDTAPKPAVVSLSVY